MLFLYIDPGTGSILFSILLGMGAASYFLLKALIIKVKSFFTGRKEKSTGHYPFVIYNEGNQYWNVFKPVLCEFEKRAVPVMYFTSSQNDPFFKKQFNSIQGKYIGDGLKAFTFLNFLKADIVLMTTPSLEVYQLKRSKSVKHYSHILHDTGDVTCYRLFGTDWFDSILLSGDYQKKDLLELEHIRGTQKKEFITVGSTYLNVLLEKKNEIRSEETHSFTVLVSPSWGPGSLLSHFGERLLDPLAETGWKIIIRPHPQSRKSEAAVLEKLENEYSGNEGIVWDHAEENLESLSKADIMISDFSSIIFDFIFLFQKPFIYSNAHFNSEMYDSGDLDHGPWKFQVLREIGIELKDNQLQSIKTVISTAVKDKEITKNITIAKNTAWQYIGESGKRTVDYLTAKHLELSQE
jgi:hypothetical protein